MLTAVSSLARWRRDEALRFLLVGGWNTLFGYVAFATLYAWLHDSVHYLVIGVIAHVVAVLQAFIAHRWLVFRSTRPWPGEFVRFNLVQLGSLVYGLVGLATLVDVLHWHPLVSQAVVMSTAIVLTYVLHRRFTFATWVRAKPATSRSITDVDATIDKSTAKTASLSDGLVRTPAPSAASSLAPDHRPAGLCPLCRSASRPLDSLAFAPKPPLASMLEIEYCGGCDFIFATDVGKSAYQRYYASVQNDADHVVLSDRSDSQDRLQVARLDDCLGPGFAGRVLDFGCGRGALLQQLADRYPRASLTGHDVANYLPESSGIDFAATIDDIVERFDVIIVSHVLEHLIDFDVLRRLERLLAPDGLVYLEVPDTSRYRTHPRREFMYYFDRLHLNHFSVRAMRKLVDRFGLDVRCSGRHRFAYRDGHYPALFCIAMRASDRGRECGDPDHDDAVDDVPLDAIYRAYRRDEALRAERWRDRLSTTIGRDPVLVYGAGDNFQRSRWSTGPLDGVPVVAVMDRRAAELHVADGLPVMAPDAALARYPDAPVVITTSQQADAIADSIRAASPGRVVVLV